MELSKISPELITLMKAYLAKSGCSMHGKEAAFAEKVMGRIIDAAISTGERMPFIHNLGYLQVLEHEVAQPEKNIEHVKKFGNKDFSLVWVKHPMFIYHNFAIDKELQDKVKQKALDGKLYLKELVSGDAYVA